MHEQCLVLKEMGHEVVVLEEKLEVPQHWNKREIGNIIQRDWGGIRVYSHYSRGIATSRLLLLNQRIFVRGMRKLYKYVIQREGRPDVIYAHFASRAGVSACFVGNEYGVPVVTIEHGGLVMENKHIAFLKKWLNFVVSNSKVFICVSEAQKKCIEKLIGVREKIKVVPNMVDKRFTYKAKPKSPTFIIFSAGNLIRGKCMDLLISAFDDAFQTFDDVELRIAGEGKERKLLEKIIAEKQLGNKVKLLGRLNRQQMLDEYTKCSVFAMASNHESFGIVYREALCVGRPVVSTDNGGIWEGWDDSFGIIVPKDNLKELSQALRKAYLNYDRFDLFSISQKCLVNTSPSNVMGKIEKELKNAM